jgi:hypothetical protein
MLDRLYTIGCNTQAASCGGTRWADSVMSVFFFQGLLITHPFDGELQLAAADQGLVI